ncbi:MAG TPA: cation:dicarboxylase symporter family transporter [Novosphingobium sp.]|nr:cation:dicarboxylase symporter family transporter [Novosphingobium sp.]
MSAEGPHAAANPPSEIRLPVGWTFAALAGGLALGLAVAAAARSALAPALTVAETVGGLWLDGLRMTIVPLVAALLFSGIARTVAAAQAGRLARRALVLFFAILFAGAIMAALVTPALLALVPIPSDAAASLREGLAGAEPGPVPTIADFFRSLVPTNALAAAANDAILPLIVFVALFALAATRLVAGQRDTLVGLFDAIGEAMLLIIGWILRIAPLGVLGLSFAVAAKSGSSAIAALVHYIVVVSAVGTVVFVAAYAVAFTLGRQSPMRFARALLPAQAVALSTQSSLASLPAMLAACRALGVREATADLVLPLAVALFRATGPAMNLAVAIYVARWFGIELTLPMLAAGVAVATLTTIGAVSLPGAISFVSSIGPIALAMGVPIGPLALLVAVEMLPDLMRTLGNVTMDVAVTAAADRAGEG